MFQLKILVRSFGYESINWRTQASNGILFSSPTRYLVRIAVESMNSPSG
jgi:hypothetical protein